MIYKDLLCSWSWMYGLFMKVVPGSYSFVMNCPSLDSFISWISLIKLIWSAWTHSDAFCMVSLNDMRWSFHIFQLFIWNQVFKSICTASLPGSQQHFLALACCSLRISVSLGCCLFIDKNYWNCRFVLRFNDIAIENPCR